MKERDEGPFPEADRFPAAHDGPRFELEMIGRSLDDLSPGSRDAQPRGIRLKLAWSAAAVLLLVALLGWLLVGR